MAQTPHLDDVAHIWGEDLRLSPSGDLGRSNGVSRANEHVLRRLCTVAGKYIFEPRYGAGLPARVGTLLDLAKERGNIRGQMQQEPAVSQSPEPVVDVREIADGIAASVQYTALPDKQPVTLSFKLD